MAMQKGWGPFGLHGATQILAAEPRQNSLRAPQSSLKVNTGGGGGGAAMFTFVSTPKAVTPGH